MRILNIGIIGCGMVANNHIKNFLQFPNVEIRWICDQSKTVLNNFQKKYSISLGTVDYHQILEDADVDAVVICTPPNSHFKMAIDSLRSGKHILLEKPSTITRQDLSELQEAVIKHPSLIVLDCSARHSRLQPKFNYFKEMISSGELGHIYCIHHNAVNRASRPGIEYHPQAKWFLNKNISGGGPLIDWGVYDLSFHLGILGDIFNLINVRAFIAGNLDNYTKNLNICDVEEHAIVLMEFDNNLVYYWERAVNAHNEVCNETRIYGTKGGLKFSYLSWESPNAEYYLINQKGKYIKRKIKVDMQKHSTSDNDFYEMDSHFIACILKQESPILPFSLSSKYLNIIFDCIDNSDILTVPTKNINKRMV